MLMKDGCTKAPVKEWRECGNKKQPGSARAAWHRGVALSRTAGQRPSQANVSSVLFSRSMGRTPRALWDFGGNQSVTMNEGIGQDQGPIRMTWGTAEKV